MSFMSPLKEQYHTTWSDDTDFDHCEEIMVNMMQEEWCAYCEQHSLNKNELTDVERTTIWEMLTTLEKELEHTQQMIEKCSC